MGELDITLESITDASDTAHGAQQDPSKKLACQFVDGKAFVAAIEANPQMQEMHAALCTTCTFLEYRDRGTDVVKAKKAFRELSKQFHPDRVKRVFPDCAETLNLRSLATDAMMKATLLINKYCRPR